MRVKLSKPLEFDGKKFDELELKLEDLTGADIKFCVREATAAKGEAVRVLVTDSDFHAQLAARACGLPAEAIEKLSARDYVEVVTTVQAFLTGLG